MIETNQPNLDLGELPSGTEKFFEVKISNTYLEAKVITTQMSCGSCTFFVSGPDVIPPGHEGTFKFKFAPTATGDTVKSIFFNVDGKTEQTFLFRAKVV